MSRAESQTHPFVPRCGLGVSRLSLGRSASCSKHDCFLSKYDAEVLHSAHTPGTHKETHTKGETVRPTCTISVPISQRHTHTHTQAFTGHYRRTAGFVCRFIESRLNGFPSRPLLLHAFIFFSVRPSLISPSVSGHHSLLPLFLIFFSLVLFLSFCLLSRFLPLRLSFACVTHSGSISLSHSLSSPPCSPILYLSVSRCSVVYNGKTSE